MRLNKLTYCSLIVALMAFQQSYAIESIDLKAFHEAFVGETIEEVTHEQANITCDTENEPSDYIVNPEKYQQVSFLQKDIPQQSNPSIDLFNPSYFTAFTAEYNNELDLIHHTNYDLDKKQSLLQKIQILRE